MATRPRTKGPKTTSPGTNNPKANSTRTGTAVQRCAIYTRVSTEHGLDMEFNSLDAQWEACEAYIRSQKHEGWICLPGTYNDGGYSGGSLERPDVRRLMDDIRGGRLDIVVVYKVDRLTRSLADFARLVELFDAHGVSIVSVTQAFNTTGSMGRLTLNVLLSFAQFEREVTGERIRDKIAASKKKGIRMGGPVPLGYSLRDKKLVVDEAEAATVRRLFEGYLEHGSLTALMRHLEGAGIMTKRMMRKDGSVRGGVRFGKGALAYLLRNRVYIGEIIHKGQHYPGEHPPIVSRDLFEAVQTASNHPNEQKRRRRAAAHLTFPLAGRIFDDRGNRMTPTVARKNGAHYRYYVSAALAQGRHAEVGTITRVSAQDLERAIAKHLAQSAAKAKDATHQNGHMPSLSANSLGTNSLGTGNPHDTSSADSDRAAAVVPNPEFNFNLGSGASLDSDPHPKLAVDLGTIDSVTITPSGLLLTRMGNTGPATTVEMILWKPASHRRRRAIIAPDNDQTARPIRAETRARLLLGIAKARRWLDDLVAGRVTDTHAIAVREGCSERSVRTNLGLAFLPPATVKAALDGTLPAGKGITELANAPLMWGAWGPR